VTRRKRASNRPPDIEIGAAAKARKLRFRSKPESEVEFEGGTRVRSDERIEEIDLETDSGSERRNLPDEVEPGVTYRDVEVGWSAEARAVVPEELEGEPTSPDRRTKRRKRPRSS
jgi:hypothetical protein